MELSFKVRERLRLRHPQSGADLLASMKAEDSAAKRDETTQMDLALVLRDLLRQGRITSTDPANPLQSNSPVGDLMAAPLELAAENPAPAQPSDQPVQTFADGRYRIIRQLGSGATSIVYLAEQTSLNRSVALKVMKVRALPEGVTEEELRKRFELEARSIGSLGHPHVVQIHDFGNEGGKLWYAMEYLSGGTLAKRVATEGPLSAAAVLELMIAAAEGLDAAWDRGILHRDVKPGNILLNPIKIADFGFAKDLTGRTGTQFQRLTAASTALGTPEFISPEVADFRPVDHRSDIYSLGATAYYAATGRYLFDLKVGASPIEWFHRHLTESPVQIGQLVPSFDKDLAAIIHRCLAKDPSARHAFYKSLVRDLRKLVGKIPPAPTRRTPRPSAISAAEKLDAQPGVATSVQDALEVERFAVERALEERFGAGCLSVRPDFMLALWSLGKSRGLPQFLSAIAARPADVLDREISDGLTALSMGSPEAPAITLCLGDYLTEGLRRLDADRKANFIPDTGAVEGFLGFLKDATRDPALARFEVPPVADAPPPPAPGNQPAEAFAPTSTARPLDPEPPAQGAKPASSEALKPGDQIGSFEIVAEVGRGGMATVYRAIDPAIDRIAALKVFDPRTQSLDAAGEARFEREAKMAASLAHPNVVQVYTAGKDEARGLRWLAMEYVPGKTLERVLFERTFLPVPEALGLIRQALEGLRAAHQVGIIHRDIKPSNLLVIDSGPEREPVLKIADFGLMVAPRRGGERITAAHEIIASPAWASPEQATGKTDLDGRTDIYSMGVVLYELLSGRLPYPNIGDALEHFAQLQKDSYEPTPLHSVMKAIPNDVVRLVERMMAKKYEDRFASVSEVIAEVDQLLARLESGELEEPPKSSARLWIVAGTLAVGTLIGVILTSLLGNHKPSQGAAGAAPSPSASGLAAGPSASPSALARVDEVPPRIFPYLMTLGPEDAIPGPDDDAFKRKAILMAQAAWSPGPEETLQAFYRDYSISSTEAAVVRRMWGELEARESVVLAGDDAGTLKLYDACESLEGHTPFTRSFLTAARDEIALARATPGKFYGALRVGQSISLVLSDGTRVTGVLKEISDATLSVLSPGVSEASTVLRSKLSPETWIGETSPPESLQLRILYGDPLTTTRELFDLADQAGTDAAAAQILAHLPLGLEILAIRTMATIDGAPEMVDKLATEIEQRSQRLPGSFRLVAEIGQGLRREIEAHALLKTADHAQILDRYSSTHAKSKAIAGALADFTKKPKIERLVGGQLEDWDVIPLEEDMKERQKHFYYEAGSKALTLNEPSGVRQLLRKVDESLEGYTVELKFTSSPTAEKSLPAWALLLTDKKESYLQIEGTETGMELFERSSKDAAVSKRIATFETKAEWLTISVVPVGKRLLVYCGNDMAFNIEIPAKAARSGELGLGVTHGTLRIKSLKVPGEKDPNDD